MPKAARARCRPVPFTSVAIEGEFWGPRLDTNRNVTLPIEYAHLKKTGRLDAWKLEWKRGDPNPPHVFWDSDVAKWMEAAAYSLTTHPDPKLERQLDAVIALMKKAQRRDGYLNTHYIAVEPRKRWTNLRDCHELYCAGHLMEAAVAYHAATGKRLFLDIMCRYADHIARVFGPRKGQKRGYPGHEETELALVKLYRATGRRRYLDLAAFFVNERGRRPHYFAKEAKARGEKGPPHSHGSWDYNQSHAPVREQAEVVGHAVRAMYLYSGMADVAEATGDASLLAACRRLWRNLTEKRMHVTGGIGPVSANEGFTFDYDLPTETAYLETCAAIGLVFWAHRMLHADPDGAYADVMERALYNGVLSGVSLEGDTFFYANPLATYPGTRWGGRHYRRSPWFGCACCPTNVVRLLASLGGYAYSQAARGAWVHLYVNGRARVETAGQAVGLTVRTAYPYGETVRIAVRPATPADFALHLRIPAWCRRPRLKVNGRAVALGPITKKGYAAVRRTWRKGDRVELVLPMPAERVEAHPEARQTCGRVALVRGPVVYCLEEVDNGPCLNDVALPRGARLAVRRDRAVFGGVPVITAAGRRRRPGPWRNALYRPAGSATEPARLKAVPYALWAHRRPGEMTVWIRE
jgi:DUF1680 family protein